MDRSPVGFSRGRPVGLPTRGKTATGRLRGVDAFVALYEPGLLTRRDGPWVDALFVDVGFGAAPWTTVESAARFRRLNPALAVLGVEIEPERVAAAAPYADAHTFFRRGGFNLPLATRADGRRETVRLVRAFNVLRQYDEAAVAEAWALMGRDLLPGGLLVEGTSNPAGDAWAAALVRKDPAGPAADALRLEGLAFGLRLRHGFDPATLQAILPKRYIHRMVAGEPVQDFFTAWRAAWRACRPERVWGPRRLFMATAERLAADGVPVSAPRRLTRRGFLIWRPPS
jgi:hypothetical protein